MPGNAVEKEAAVGNTTNRFTLINARSGVITAAGTTGNLVSCNNVLLTGNAGVGTSANTIQTAATNLAVLFVGSYNDYRTLHSFPTRRSSRSDLGNVAVTNNAAGAYYNVTVDAASTGT